MNLTLKIDPLIA